MSARRVDLKTPESNQNRRKRQRQLSRGWPAGLGFGGLGPAGLGLEAGPRATLDAPDWTAQGWEISVFHDLWARQLGVLNMTEKDIEIRAWLQKLSPHIESWSLKARIKVNVLLSTIYSWPIQPGVLATSTWIHQAGSELHHWQGQTFVLECTFHCAVVDSEHLFIPYYDFEPHAVSIWDRAPAILAPPTVTHYHPGLDGMGYVGLRSVQYCRFLRLQTAFVCPDGNQVREHIWVKVPVMRVKHGTSRGKKSTTWTGRMAHWLLREGFARISDSHE
ncbi:hypothetical protein C8J57DRAFT_1262816 [Mycena rebaudengoi]|nr:hypothetical protein C8J57DRAFT_1262816 [Mycena rebaudengoi]